ncbi:uncharacterized protein [Lolium perenne]|uniref:uncharacterized protein n=1 Tax=Lolium perenne TaxID=4522 RepID=UPI003A992000
MSSSLSDHAPLLLRSVVDIPGGRRFRFDSYWVKLQGFQDVVAASWGRLLVANEVILQLDKAQELQHLGRLELSLRRGLKQRVMGLASLERTIAIARVEGVKDVGASTQFFRIQASKRRRRNHIDMLRDGERGEVDQSEKEALATAFYEDLLGQPQPREHDLSLPAIGLHPVDLSSMDAPFSADEIWWAVKAMPSNKSTGPDGLTWEFFRACWAVIKADVIGAVQVEFGVAARSLHRLNSTFITLKPKAEDAADIRQFQPISLVHSFAKLVTKIMALRLASWMGELVSANQSAIIWGRCIQDNFVLVHQSAWLLHRKKVPALLLKLDVARTFNSVSWPFLLSVLRQRGFGHRWISWLILLLSSASTQVLVNGCAGSAFRHGRGLRQGDPLSPLLFVLLMDVLDAMFRAAERVGVLVDLAVDGLKHRVLLYADDIVVFARPEEAELVAVREILACFGAASGLYVNFLKSSAAPIRCNDDLRHAVTSFVGCQFKDLPQKYLGLPLSLRKPSKAQLQPILDKLANKLAFWKARLMSRDDRVAYVRVLMAASVVYQLMALDVEPWFLQAVDKLRRGFLWAGKNEAHGRNCLVAWVTVCVPKHLGWLGFPNLRWMHAALRARWMWLQRTDSSKSWAGFRFAVRPDALALFNASVTISVGTGDRLLFWEDPWINGLSAAAIAPVVLKLIRPGIVKTRTVDDVLRLNARALEIVGGLSVQVVLQYLRLWQAVAAVPMHGGEDSFRWKWTDDGRFTTRLAYRVFFHGTTTLPGAKHVWNSFAPFKFRFHAWLSLRGRCWTTDRRLRRGLPSHVLCPLVQAETANHLAVQCFFARAVWDGFARRSRVAIPLPGPDSELSFWWPHSADRLSRKDARVLNAVMLLLRCFWVERNARVFEGTASTVGQVLEAALQDWRLWCAGRGGSGRGVFYVGFIILLGLFIGNLLDVDRFVERRDAIINDHDGTVEDVHEFLRGRIPDCPFGVGGGHGRRRRSDGRRGRGLGRQGDEADKGHGFFALTSGAALGPADFGLV